MAQERNMAVLALDGSLAGAFVSALAGSPADRFELAHPDGSVTIEAIGPDAFASDAFNEKLKDAAGVIIVVQHVDAASVEELRKLVARLPQEVFLPTAFALHREPGHPEFKLSCGNCGQKLWVADSHEGRPGRCPGCKQSFIIPSQQRHVAAALQLPPDAPIRTLERGSAAAAVALVNDLADRLAARDAATHAHQKNTTMRIVIDPEALH